jgi:hypothetical protein
VGGRVTVKKIVGRRQTIREISKGLIMPTMPVRKRKNPSSS